ncbi:MAG: hypothetical protein ABI286_07260 [Edaphobacter sp.]
MEWRDLLYAFALAFAFAVALAFAFAVAVAVAVTLAFALAFAFAVARFKSVPTHLRFVISTGIARSHRAMQRRDPRISLLSLLLLVLLSPPLPSKD